jgi:hypothetical protein
MGLTVEAIDSTSDDHGSPFEEEVESLSKAAWGALRDKKNGIFTYWVDSARRHPDQVAVKAA